jgi:hypothetical protein
MRLWQRRAHPWIWFLALAAIVAALSLLFAAQPSFLSLR